jgi:hypothetical protein
MATSAVELCSNALLLLGQTTINSFDDDSERATLMANLWPNARNAILRMHPWNCAIKRVALAPEVTAPAFDWTYSFVLPGDWLRTLDVGEDGDDCEFKMEGGKILADSNPLYLRYIFRNENVATWDALLVQAATAYMAMQAAYPITKSASMMEAMKVLYQSALRDARTTDGQEDTQDAVGDFPFLQAHRVL